MKVEKSAKNFPGNNRKKGVETRFRRPKTYTTRQKKQKKTQFV
jgi:hypothetical protein